MEKYIIVSTTSNKYRVLKKIQEELLNSRLVACCQISRVESFFRWNRKNKKVRELKLQVKTRKRLIKKVISIIKYYHNYEVPEIIYHYMYADKEYTDWIKNNTL